MILSMAMNGIVPYPAAAVLPDNVTVEYYIHEIPDNAESEIVFIVQLDLTAVDSDGDSVGWGISAATFTEVGATPPLDRVWRDDFSSFSTTDGLWWVEHDATLEPTLSEFLIPPALSGTAVADDNSYADLDYAVAGNSPGTRPGPYTHTAFLDYFFTEQGEPDPIVEAEDEPAELTGTEDPD